MTVDTEVWPKSPDWRSTNLAADMDRDIYGITGHGEYGLRYQLESLDRFALHAEFFVESLFATAVGPARLREIVRLIHTRGQNVQLHVHPEWLQWMAHAALAGTRSQYLKDFTTDEQTLLIALALENLRECGVDSVQAFRAGNYGAGLNTLEALRRNNVRCDTSYNFPYLSTQCGMALSEPLLRPCELEGVVEYPVTFFEDWPGHHRHLQITACSFAEIRHVLLEAYRQGWPCVVLVFHSFELIRNRKTRDRPLLPDEICVRRFEKLCRFLSEHRQQFPTMTFTEFSERGAISASTVAVEEGLKSNPFRTAQRFIEQAVRRVA
jgi:hypothetical protein